RHGDFAIVACAAVATDRGVRLAVGGVADMPVSREFEALKGSALDDALNAFAWDLDARDDFHATARYRRDLVRMIGRELVAEVAQCRPSTPNRVTASVSRSTARWSIASVSRGCC